MGVHAGSKPPGWVGGKEALDFLRKTVYLL